MCPEYKVVAVDIEKITHPAEATASAHQPEPALSRA
jgi:hypothetical protein